MSVAFLHQTHRKTGRNFTEKKDIHIIKKRVKNSAERTMGILHHIIKKRIKNSAERPVTNIRSLLPESMTAACTNPCCIPDPCNWKSLREHTHPDYSVNKGWSATEQQEPYVYDGPN